MNTHLADAFRIRVLEPAPVIIHEQQCYTFDFYHRPSRHLFKVFGAGDTLDSHRYGHLPFADSIVRIIDGTSLCGVEVAWNKFPAALHELAVETGAYIRNCSRFYTPDASRRLLECQTSTQSTPERMPEIGVTPEAVAFLTQ